jgi:prepilin-type N-terminal cleavage/methylation domain-containing protein
MNSFADSANGIAFLRAYGRRSQRGFSLLELLLVVAVGAVLILAGLGAYRLVSENNNTNQATRLITTLKQQVQQAYQGQASYGSGAGIVDDLVSLRALPSDLATVGTGDTMTAKGMFGAITIIGNATNFSIAFANVPKGACIRLAQQFTPQNANDFVSLSVGSTALTQASPATAFSQVAMAAACSDQTSVNTITWTFQ